MATSKLKTLLKGLKKVRKGFDLGSNIAKMVQPKNTKKAK